MLFGQNDSIRILPQVEVKANSIRYAPIGSSGLAFDKNTFQKLNITSVAEMLGRESGVFIKSYGPGSLATSSVRGGSASHTALVWNGFPIQSPMLGQLDLSLLPSYFMDEAALTTGGGSAVWGSGAIGGVISLRSESALEREGLTGQWQSSLGSFGWLGQQAKFQFKHKKLAGTFRFFHQEAANDFQFTIANQPKKQSHAAFSQQGFMQNLLWQITDKQSLAAHFWWQDSDREIPPTTTQNRSKAEQFDKIFRSALEWKRLGNNSIITAKTAFFQEEIDYRDSLSGVFDLTKFQTGIGELEAQWQPFRHGSLLFGFNQSFTKAEAEAYGKVASQEQTAFLTGFRFEKKRWKAQLDGRTEHLDGRWLPFIPSLGLEWNPHKQLIVKGKIARNYRYPTLNDRFWQPGGNPDLLPEQGWSEEITLRPSILSNDKKQLDYQITVFNRLIKNWILWAIQPGEIYYSPSNVAEVWSRGIEQQLNFSATIGPSILMVKIGYDYIRSTNQKDIQSPALKAGEQLIYVPEHQAFGTLNWHFKKWQINYQHRYTGPVSTQTEALNAYQLGYFFLEKEFPIRPVTARLSFYLDNIWDANYRVVERRPMPGRSFRIGLSIDFEKYKP